MKITQLPSRIKSRLEPITIQKKYGKILVKNKKLKNSQKGKRCFIIGTGPSVKNQDLTKLKDEDTFVVNTFWRHPDYQKINPKYYIVVDTYSFPQSKGEKNAWIKDLIDRDKVVALCQTKLFFNVIGKSFIEKNKIFINNEIYYLAFNGFFNEKLKFNIEIDKITPNVKNVILACLITAVYMGFEEIYLLGCEHDFLAHPIKDIYNRSKHFYTTKQYDMDNKEEMDYYALVNPSYEREIDHVKMLFKNYRLFKTKIAKTHPRVKIFNATPDSFLDIFPFINFTDIKFKK